MSGEDILEEVTSDLTLTSARSSSTGDLSRGVPEEAMAGKQVSTVIGTLGW